MGCGDASGWSKIALIVVIIGMALHIAGWATLSWIFYQSSDKKQSVQVGLWQMESCTNGQCTEVSVSSIYVNGSFNAVRAFETIAFLVYVFIVILLFIYVFFDSARRRGLAQCCMYMCFAGGVISFIGMCIWIAYCPNPFVVSWSLGLTVIAFILVLIGGALLIPECFEPKYY